MRGSAAKYLAIGGASCLLLTSGAGAQMPKRLVLNTTASAPLGLYWLANPVAEVGDLALVYPPPHLARWLANRGYLPVNVPLIKRVVAVEGQTVCGADQRVMIDGRAVAEILQRDRLGRPLAGIKGCRRLARAEVLLLNADAPGSLDGRYFGPVPRQAVAGRLLPLWTWGR